MPNYLEKLVSERFGVARADLKYLRDHTLSPDVDWTWGGAGKPILFTQSGVDHLKKIFGEKDLSGCEEERAPAAAERVTAKVNKIYPNPRLMRCILTDWKTFVDVQVPRNEMFRAGMMVPIVKFDGVHWKLDGPLPRRPGFYPLKR